MQTQTRTTGKVQPAKAWRHKATGATASVHGAHPSSGAPGNQPKDWEIVDTGWTVAWPDGTVGCMRPPFETKVEAQEYVDAHPTFPGWQQD